jgi:hypothetical protein
VPAHDRFAARVAELLEYVGEDEVIAGLVGCSFDGCFELGSSVTHVMFVSRRAQPLLVLATTGVSMLGRETNGFEQLVG